MSGSGSREGFGSPPWDPADPVPELEDTKALPGLGTVPGPDGAARPGASGRGGPGVGTAEPDDGAAAGQAPGRAAGAGPAADRRTADGQAAGGPAADGDDAQAGGGEQRADARPGRRRKRRRSFVRELPVLIVVALVLALVIKTYAIQAFYIPSASMENTLDIGDRVLINKLVYDFRGIHRGDIVVFDGTGSWDLNQPPSNTNIFTKFVNDVEGIVGISHDSDIYIKRVIGLPGDHVACCTSGKVTVNGVPLTEQSYLFPGNAPSTDTFKVTVPAGRLWVMGDHRDVSYDSRGHIGNPGGGTVPEGAVLGRAFVIIWPPSRWGVLDIPATFQQPQLNASAAAAGGSSAALAAALANGTPVRPAGSPLPLALGFAGAVPLTLLQRGARRRLSRRLSARRARRRG